MKKILPILILLISGVGVYAGQKDPVSEAEALFASGEYSGGLKVLHEGLRDRSLETRQRMPILQALAQFYEKIVGDVDRASGLYRQILNSDLDPGHPIRSLAQKEINRFESLKKEYAQQNALLDRLGIKTGRRRRKKASIEEDVARLRALIEQDPEYYRLADAYYYLGLNYAALGKNRKACAALARCAEIRPGINYYLPVGTYARLARAAWLRSLGSKSAWRTVLALLIVTAAVFYNSRPWRWLGFREAAAAIMMVLLWWVVFTLSSEWLGRGFQASEAIIRKIDPELPAFVSAAPGSPGSGITRHLFFYGLVGVLGVFVFSVGMSRLRYKWMRMLVNSIFGLLLCASLTTIFYLRYCDRESLFYSGAKGKLYYLKGNMCFCLSGPEPYILTNPRAYSNLSLNNISDPDLYEWVMKHCPVETPDQRLLKNTNNL